jgi:cytochrome c-type biogenesis protein CcmH
MKQARILSSIVACAAIAVLAGTPVPAQAGQKDVEARLACQCGCGLTVLTCNHLQCGFAIPVREEIAAKLAEGLSDDDIVASLVEEYGEKVLSSPTHTGFNLLAWYTPYVAVLIGGAFVFFIMRRWRRTTVPPPTETGEAQGQRADRAGRAELERELEELDS